MSTKKISDYLHVIKLRKVFLTSHEKGGSICIGGPRKSVRFCGERRKKRSRAKSSPSVGDGVGGVSSDDMTEGFLLQILRQSPEKKPSVTASGGASSLFKGAKAMVLLT